jgi:hypothetical protein
MYTTGLPVMASLRKLLVRFSAMPPARRLEDRIRELCADLSCASEAELVGILSELQAAITEYIRRVDNKTSAIILNFPNFPRERRKPLT